MRIVRKILCLAAVGGLSFSPMSVLAESTGRDAVKADIADWAAKLSQAFGPGYWDGQMQSFDANGKLLESDDRPACLKPGESNTLGSQLGALFSTTVDQATCSSKAGGPGSLDLKLVCTRPDTTRIEFESTGSYDGERVDWDVKFITDAETPSPIGAMKVSAHRVRKTC